MGDMPRVGFKQRLHGQGFVVVDGRRVKVHQQPVQFAGGQHRHLAQRALRIMFKCIRQAIECSVEVTQQALGTHLARRLGLEAKAAGNVVHGEHQRVTEDVFAAEQGDARHQLRRSVCGGMPVIEQAVEQRRHLAATLSQGEGGLFMDEQCAQLAMGVAHRLDHALPGQAQAQRQGVDEHAEGAVAALAALHAPQQHGAEHHAFLARGAGQHPRPSQVKQAGGADAQQSRLSAQALIEGWRQRKLDLFDGTTVTAYVLQAKRQGRLADIAEHLAEELFMLLLADPQARLGHIVAVRRGVASGLRLPQQAGLHLMAHAVEGGVVEDDMVEQQDRHHPLIGRVLGIHQAHQRRLVCWHAVATRVEALVQSLDHIGLHRQLRLAPHHLQRLRQALPDHRSAQDVVAIDDLLQRMGEGVQARQAVKRQVRLQQVRVTLPGTDVMVENAFLQRRQRIDVLHIGCTAGDLGDHPIDRRLIEVNQR